MADVKVRHFSEAITLKREKLMLLVQSKGEDEIEGAIFSAKRWGSQK